MFFINSIYFIIAVAVFALEPEIIENEKWTAASLLEKSKPEDWRKIDPENSLQMELSTGVVIIEMNPAFAPKHVKNIKILSREHYWNGLAVVRVQDNYVAQWGDPNAENPNTKRKIKKAKETLTAEFDAKNDSQLPFFKLKEEDSYAHEVGYSLGFPLARDLTTQKMWLLHCYGMVGAGRNTPSDSGGGAELYAVIGHAPRHLDRNVTLVGRVVMGIEKLSSLPRGSGPMGFYTAGAERSYIKSIRVVADIAKNERLDLEVLRTDTPLFEKWVEARRNRTEEWFVHKAGKLDVCNLPVPVREVKKIESENKK